MASQTSAPVLSRQTRTFFSHAIETVREIERVNAEGGMPVDFRPVSALAPRFSLEGVQSQALSLWQTSSRTGFVTTPKVQADVITIRFVTAGTMVRHDYRGEHVGRSGYAMMVMFDAVRSAEASSGFAAVSGTVTRSSLAAARAALEGQDGPVPLPRFVPVVDATGLPLQSLMQALNNVFKRLKAGVQDTDFIFPLLEEVMVYRLLTAWPREGPDDVQRAAAPGPRPMRRARDYIDEHISRKILLSDVAGAAGIGVRRLQMMFRAETGKTPVQFILERRLDRARLDLRAAAGSGISVGEIAERWGFAHMGDFTRRYRARFSELPSLTRRTDRPGP